MERPRPLFPSRRPVNAGIWGMRAGPPLRIWRGSRSPQPRPWPPQPRYGVGPTGCKRRAAPALDQSRRSFCTLPPLRLHPLGSRTLCQSRIRPPEQVGNHAPRTGVKQTLPHAGHCIGIEVLAFRSVPQNQIAIRRKRLRFGEEPRQNEQEVDFCKKSRRERYIVRGDVEHRNTIDAKNYVRLH